MILIYVDADICTYIHIYIYICQSAQYIKSKLNFGSHENEIITTKKIIDIDDTCFR